MATCTIATDESKETAAALRIHGGRIDLGGAALSVGALTMDRSVDRNQSRSRWPVPSIAPERYQRLPLASELAEMTAAAAGAYGLPANAACCRFPAAR